MFERVVIPLDGSEAAECTVPYGIELAHHLGAPLHLVRVVDMAAVPGPGARAGQSLGADLEAELTMAGEYLTVVGRRLEGLGVTVTLEVLVGDARRELLAACRQRDLLVMASHGLGSHPGVPLGSVAEEVARLARAPIMIIRVEGTSSRSTSRASVR